jgi:hypothetical protein
LKKEFSIKLSLRLFIEALIFILIDNLISLTIWKKITGVAQTILLGHINPAIFSIHSLLISIIIATLFGFAGLIVQMNFSFELFVEPIENKETNSAVKKMRKV